MDFALTAHHHPTAETLSGHALGGLALGPSLAVNLHLETCLTCRSKVQQIEEEEGQRMLSLPGAALASGALERVLARIAGVAPNPVPVHTQALLPNDVRLPSALEKLGLSPPIHLAPDTWIAHLNAPRDGGWRTYLVCAAADAVVPRHGHTGDEMIVVLEGGFNDGRPFAVGDFAENPTGFVHEMQVSPEGRLVALISSAGAIDWGAADRGIGAFLDI